MRTLNWRRNYGILLGVIAILTHFLLWFLPPTFTTQLYQQGIYLVLKWAMLPLQWLPFPVLYLFILLCLWGGVLFFKKLFASYSPIALLWRSLHWIGWIAFLFYLLWGFNYRAQSLWDYYSMPRESPAPSEVVALFDEVTVELGALREELQQAGDLSDPSFDREVVLDAEIQWLKSQGLYLPVPARVKPMFSGSLLRLGTAGFYFPLAGEGYYDRGLHPLVKPHVMAHELAHNYGFTDEGEANFVAFQSLYSSSDPLLRYIGLLDLWRYLSLTVSIMDPEIHEQTLSKCSKGVLNDLEEIRRQHGKFPDLFPKLRDAIYETYLHSQGVNAGLDSYTEIIELEIAFRKLPPAK